MSGNNCKTFFSIPSPTYLVDGGGGAVLEVDVDHLGAYRVEAPLVVVRFVQPDHRQDLCRGWVGVCVSVDKVCAGSNL